MILLAVLLTRIHLADGMMGVGKLMNSGTGGPPAPTFYLTNDSGVKLTNDAGTQRITTQ